MRGSLDVALVLKDMHATLGFEIKVTCCSLSLSHVSSEISFRFVRYNSYV